MAVGAVQLYDTGILNLVEDSGRQWDGSGDFTFALLVNDYSPSDSHSEWGDVSGHECTDSDYSQVAVGSRALSNSSGTIYGTSSNANFGSSVTISARYLVCVAGTAGSLNSTDKVIWYQDLNDGGSGNVSSNNSSFVVNQPTNGWFSFAQS